MLRNFIELVNEAVDSGSDRGVQLFMENLEVDMAKDAMFEQAGGFEPVLNALFEDVEINSDFEDIDEEEIDEDAVDAALAELEDDLDD